jgi:hypothetical protein
MDILIFIIGVIAIITLIDLAAVGLGVDSRPFSTDHHAPLQDLSAH